MNTKVKICGITRAEDARVCADEGADFLGFVFVETSPRCVDAERAASIVRSLGDDRPKIVGVFRDAPIETIREIAQAVPLDFVQLHGTESDDDVSAIGVPAIKTFRVGGALPDTNAVPSAGWLLFDTYDERRDGGTGRRFDWSLLALYPRTRPFFLAGGVAPDNVAAAISLVRPDAIDVSSGVEQEPGVKDHDKVRALFERVKR